MSRRSPTMPVRRGFTLVEMVMALGILAVGTALAVPAFLRLTQEDDLTRATRSVESLFRIARDSAIAGGRPVTVVVDSVSGFVWLDVPRRTGETLDSAEVRPLDVASLELPGTVSIEVPAARTRFTFAASGQAFGEYVLLTSPLGSRTMTLDRWTGDVVVH